MTEACELNSTYETLGETFTGRVNRPVQKEQKTWATQKSFLGIYSCLFLILAVLCVNLYFVAVLNQNQQQVKDSQEQLHVQGTNPTHEVLRQNYGAVCSAIADMLEKLENSSFTAFSNASDALHCLAALKPAHQSGVLSALLLNEVEIIKRLTQSISSSVTLTSNELQNTTVVQKDNVRLANGQFSSSSIRGRLEVYRSRSWGTVCDDSFNNTDATVVCRMFGYSSGTQKESAYFGAGTGTIHMDDVACSGQETSIFSCSYTSNHNCGHGEDVGIICT